VANVERRQLCKASFALAEMGLVQETHACLCPMRDAQRGRKGSWNVANDTFEGHNSITPAGTLVRREATSYAQEGGRRRLGGLAKPIGRHALVGRWTSGRDVRSIPLLGEYGKAWGDAERAYLEVGEGMGRTCPLAFIHAEERTVHHGSPMELSRSADRPCLRAVAWVVGGRTRPWDPCDLLRSSRTLHELSMAHPFHPVVRSL